MFASSLLAPAQYSILKHSAETLKAWGEESSRKCVSVCACVRTCVSVCVRGCVYLVCIHVHVSVGRVLNVFTLKTLCSSALYLPRLTPLCPPFGTHSHSFPVEHIQLFKKQMSVFFYGNGWPKKGRLELDQNVLSAGLLLALTLSLSAST